MIAGGTTISPTGMSHTIARTDALGTSHTVCGVSITPWAGWGRPLKRSEDYPQCSRCSIYGGLPKNWVEGEHSVR